MGQKCAVRESDKQNALFVCDESATTCLCNWGALSKFQVVNATGHIFLNIF